MVLNPNNFFRQYLKIAVVLKMMLSCSIFLVTSMSSLHPIPLELHQHSPYHGTHAARTLKQSIFGVLLHLCV
jgi:hypothetical protein